MTSMNKTLISVLIKSTDNKIGEAGVKSMSGALKSNTTLTKLFLRGEDKRNNTQMVSINQHSFCSHQINRQRHWRPRDDIIE